VDSIERAQALAGNLLAEALPRRWRHVQAVASKAAEMADVRNVDREVLASSAWLHDVGYAPLLVRTGFHPLDGARFLQEQGIEIRTATLVARHSCAQVEARLRGLLDDLEAEFPELDRDLADVLCCADMTTSPDGVRVEVGERLKEIRERYGPGDVVTKFVDTAGGEITETVSRIERRCAAASQSR
jgi:hypothetical protein